MSSEPDPEAGPPAPIPKAAITGVILAGGLGRRMDPGGGAAGKGLRPLAGRPMAAHAIERLAPQVGALIVNANRDLDAWRAFGVPVVADAIEGFVGPLAGLHAAMRAARTPWVASVPCDAPRLPSDLVARLARAAAEGGARLAIARAAGRRQPVFALASCTLADALAGWLASGGRRVEDFAAQVGAVEADFDDAAAFRNLNTAEELAALERELAAHAPPR